MTDDQIREMLSFDAFSQAEKLTGKSYKDDETYMEGSAESRDYKSINAARIALMPEDVRNAINGAAS